MIELQMIEDMRTQLIQMVNNRCDELIELVLNGNLESNTKAQEKEYGLSWDMFYLLKGKKPLAIKFADGREVETLTWKSVATTILQYFNSNPTIHEKMMQLRENISGKQRIILGRNAANMDVPLKIDEELYFEAKYDTETLLRVLTKRVLEPIGCNYQGISIKYTERQRQEEVLTQEESINMSM